MELPSTTYKTSVIKNDRFSLSAIDKGGIVTSIILDGKSLTRPIPNEISIKEKGGLFVCPQIFGRLLGRKLWFRGKDYNLEYPTSLVGASLVGANLDSKDLDPDSVFIHGFEHYLKWSLKEETETSLFYELKKESFEGTFPFPHTSFVKYELTNSGLNIELGITDCEIDTPACLVFHPFFNWEIDGFSPSLKANLDRKFIYPKESEFPVPWSAPVSADNIFSSSEFTNLGKDLDHSFLSPDGVYDILWGDNFGIRIKDLTDKKTSSIFPVQVWTTGADSRGCFGIEPGAISNLFWLASQKIIPEEWLPICKPNKSISRKVCISSLF